MSSEATRRAAMVWIGAFPAAAAAAVAVKGAPLPVSTVHWDRALERYLAAREAADHDYKHGALRQALDQHEAGTLVGQTVFDAEEAHYQRFSKPKEAALHALLLTAAPTMLALRQKVWIAQSELIEGETVGDDRRPMLSIIADDLVRISSGKGA
jgi:hypothetical protein